MEEQPSGSSRRGYELDEGTTTPSSSSRRRRWYQYELDDGTTTTGSDPFRRITAPPMPVYTVTVDPQGFFHVSPFVGRDPFRSVGEALAETQAMLLRRRTQHIPPGVDPPQYMWVQWSGRHRTRKVPAVPTARIYTRTVPLRPERPRRSPWSSWKYYVTLRDDLFYAHPPDVGGPFHSLGEAAAAIKCHRTWVPATQLLTEDYYLTLKDGLFRVHDPNNGIGRLFKCLADATNAIRFDRAWRKEQKEKARRTREFLDQLDPAEHLASVKELIEAIRTGKRDPEPEPVDAVASSESEECDPEISEVIDRMDRIFERQNAIRNGMKWMQSEVLEAFDSYKKDIRYQGPKYEFVKLDRQCLIYDTLSESYHHYNFTMRRKSSFYLSKKAKRSLKRPSTRGWDYQLFFAEVKSAGQGKQVICHPLQSDENGHCFGCQNVGIDLRHPASGGYEEGHEESGFPFDGDSGSDD